MRRRAEAVACFRARFVKPRPLLRRLCESLVAAVRRVPAAPRPEGVQHGEDGMVDRRAYRPGIRAGVSAPRAGADRGRPLVVSAARSRLGWWLVAVAGLLAVVLVVLAAGRLPAQPPDRETAAASNSSSAGGQHGRTHGGGLPTPTASPSESPPRAHAAAASGPVTRDHGGQVTLPDGTGVTVPGGAVSTDTTVTLATDASDRSPAPAAPAGLLGVGRPVHLQLAAGHLTAPVTITLPVTVPRDWPRGMPFQPWAATYDETAGRWVAQPGRYDAARHAVLVTIDHFSWWNPFTWDYHAIGDSLRQAAADLAGVPSGIPPTCAHPPPADRVALASDGSTVADACLDLDGDQVVLRMRGTKDYPLLVTWSGQASLAARTEYGLDVSSAFRWAEKQSGLTGGDGVLLPAGGDVHLIVAPDGNAPVLVTATYAANLQLIGIVDAVTRVVEAVRGPLGIRKTNFEKVWSGLQHSACLVQHIDDLGPDLAGAAATIVTDCVGEIVRDLTKGATGLLRIVGAAGYVIASLLGVVAYAANTVLGVVLAGRDLLAGTTTQKWTLTATGSPAPGGPPGHGWPVNDNEGPPALYAWLGSTFVFPDWVSCDDPQQWCIAGEGAEAHIIKVPGLTDVGSVPTVAQDPAAALIGKGLPAATVAQLLRPG